MKQDLEAFERRLRLREFYHDPDAEEDDRHGVDHHLKPLVQQTPSYLRDLHYRLLAESV